MRRARRRAALACLGAGMLAAPLALGAAPREAPPLMLWAWERPEDLRFVDPARVGVAFLARTVDVAADGRVTVRPRRQPLRVRAATYRVAVVRVEAEPATPDVAAVAAAIVPALATLPGTTALQIDFDARRSQRDFYRALVDAVAARLPRGTTLSITALASWCLGDPWVDALPVAHTVPMLFRLGVDRDAVTRHLAAGGDWRSVRCTADVGLSTDETLPLPAAPRAWVFHPAPWTPAALAAVERRLGR